MPKMIPCEYIGNHRIELNKYGGPYFNAKREQLLELSLTRGDTLMMPEEEIRGYTILRDMSGQSDPLNLGSGRVVLPQHMSKSDDELMAMGYQFHQGRPDFREIPEMPARRKKEGNE